MGIEITVKLKDGVTREQAASVIDAALTLDIVEDVTAISTAKAAHVDEGNHLLDSIFGSRAPHLG